MSGNKKILIITYYWPPSGGAGVQRWLKFSKYLPEFGWEPIILTVKPEFAEYPAIDKSLEKDISPDTRVFKTDALNYFNLFQREKKDKRISAGFSSGNSNSLPSKIARFIRGNFFIPDPRTGWNKFALKEAARIIRSEKISHIITTSPPHSTQLIGLKLKKLFPGIKWIADLRDPWTGIYYYRKFYPTFISRRIDSRYESAVLKNCDTLTTVGINLGEHLISIENSVRDKIQVIYNGYDDDDFIDNPGRTGEKFIITYVGTLSDQYPIAGFISALERISNLGDFDFLFRIVGEVSSGWRKILYKKLGNNFKIVSYSDHSKAIDFMIDSDLLLLVIPEHPNNGVIITGKLFEYLRTEIPILCLGPEKGEAAEIIEQCKAGTSLDYNNPDQIGNYIRQVYNSEITYDHPERFSRRSIAEHMVKISNLPG